VLVLKRLSCNIGITKQEIDDKWFIDLDVDPVSGVTDEGLHLQILLDKAEEDFDLPAFFVDVCDVLAIGLIL
jgi:hypothetical protein